MIPKVKSVQEIWNVNLSLTSNFNVSISKLLGLAFIVLVVYFKLQLDLFTNP